VTPRERHFLKGTFIMSEAIRTTEDLRKSYPSLCNEIVQETVSEINDLGAKEAIKRLPGLVARLAPTSSTDLDGKKGFILQADDPYGVGAARAFGRATGCLTPALPCMLPFQSPGTRPAIESYILRADGAGDAVRTNAARVALSKCK